MNKLRLHRNLRHDTEKGAMMLALWLLLFALLPVGHASAAPAFVQVKACVGSLVTSTTCNITGVAPGSTLIVNCKLSHLGPCTPTSAQVTWRLAISTDHPLTGWTNEIWYAYSAAGGTVNSTFRAGQTDAIRIVMGEFSGVASSNPVQTSSSRTGVPSNPCGNQPRCVMDPPNITTTESNELLILSVGTDSDLSDSVGFTAGTGWTWVHPVLPSIACGYNGEPAQKVCYEYRLAPTPGTYGGGNTTIVTDSFVSLLVAFKGTGGGDVTAPTAPKGVTISKLNTEAMIVRRIVNGTH